jgi:hypothetical protein
LSWTSIALAQTPGARSLGGEVTLDFRYFTSNVTDDALDVVTAPLLLWRGW